MKFFLLNFENKINFIPDEQDSELMYCFAQELSGYEMGYEMIEIIFCVSLLR